MEDSGYFNDLDLEAPGAVGVADNKGENNDNQDENMHEGIQRAL